MNLDDVLATWRLQDQAPLYGVNRDLLQLVLQHEQADLRRELFWEQVGTYTISALLLAFLVVLLGFVYLDDDPRTVWDYAAAVVGVLELLAGAAALGVSRQRQARRERRYGSSLQGEIQRNLSLVDYQLSRVGRASTALLAAAPLTLAGTLCYWLVVQINNNPFGWFDVGMLFTVVGSSVWSVIETSRKAERELLPRRRRLQELLEALDAGE